MPIKIVSSPTSPIDGEINKTEMDNGISKFANNVALTTLNGNFTVIKKHACWYAKNEILNLLGIDPMTVPSNDITGLRIHFGVQPVTTTKACDNTDYSNMANTMIFATTSHNNELREVDDFMLIPGYRSYDKQLNGDCCGSMSGGNGDS